MSLFRELCEEQSAGIPYDCAGAKEFLNVRQSDGVTSATLTIAGKRRTRFSVHDGKP